MSILFKAIVGSHAYGTNIETSDEDIKFIYQEDRDKILGFGYRPQIEISKDITGFEIKRFLELLQSANPTVLELLFTPPHCILQSTPAFEILLKHKEKFLTKKCRESFGGYAAAQIRKAKGLDKKMNWEKERVEKRDPIDFCYIIDEQAGKTYPFKAWMNQPGFIIKEEQIGLVNLDHAPHCYAIYIRHEGRYNGLFAANSDYVITSSIPKGEKSIGTLVYNKDNYRIHCKEWQSYQTWLKERNMSRWTDSQKHGQLIDGKNLLHCRRLLDMAMEIPTVGLNVQRPNKDFLLQIRRGEVCLEDILKQAEEDFDKLEEIYAASNLPETVDNELLNKILLEIRLHD